MSIEAMKQALEALELYQSKSSVQMFDEAVKALRQALEEEREPLYWSVSTGWVYANDTSQERVDESVKTEHDKQVAIAQAYQRGWNAALAQQEPVAWIHDGGKGELWWYQSSKFDEEGNLIGPNPDDIPLYTAPPKKQWVGLTDAEIHDMNWYEEDRRMYRFARAIEAKLKEKNT